MVHTQDSSLQTPIPYQHNHTGRHKPTTACVWLEPPFLEESAYGTLSTTIRLLSSRLQRPIPVTPHSEEESAFVAMSTYTIPLSADSKDQNPELHTQNPEENQPSLLSSGFGPVGPKPSTSPLLFSLRGPLRIIILRGPYRDTYVLLTCCLRSSSVSLCTALRVPSGESSSGDP